ncbi:pimeloyl-ACP methyl ester carboxylesterase [Nocardiopsis arvandica]|uniref:Pimeloyl-ACP methyl ester carboxylesterase n=1 Tax=Nocardiopsis sinuspersici TaxID=501010 RepID=A0A7Y9XJ56_9ACTN|nr:alpha/beta hydrolase [Nocardiopsis sinuspersici]NYH55692.1 pimeloyl-ACP methyl ester carboxylesterase [Nocardiopsis sinuspersici]
MTITGQKDRQDLGPLTIEVGIEVSLAPGLPADHEIAGVLSLPGGGSSDTVQLLVSGGTYGSEYWLMRGDPEHPSYVETMAGAGYATLAVDRFGAGEKSSLPPSESFRKETHVHVVSQIARRLREDGVAGFRFERVVLVGHSYGSTLVRSQAVREPGSVDGLVLTGECSKPSEAAFEEFWTALCTADQDPRFAGRGIDAGYYTTRPGKRGEWFYHASTADPEVIAADERAKAADVYSEEFPPPTENTAIRVPVLIVVGEHDRLLCGEGGTDASSSEELLQQESPWYSPEACLEAVIVPDTGHALNLHRTAPQWFSAAREWCDRHIGSTGRRGGKGHGA